MNRLEITCQNFKAQDRQPHRNAAQHVDFFPHSNAFAHNKLPTVAHYAFDNIGFPMACKKIGLPEYKACSLLNQRVNTTKKGEHQ